MVRDFIMRSMRTDLDMILKAVVEKSSIYAAEFPARRILQQLNSPHFDTPTDADEVTADVATAVKDAEPKFTLSVDFYVGEELLTATGKADNIIDALGELAWDAEQRTKKELARQNEAAR